MMRMMSSLLSLCLSVVFFGFQNVSAQNIVDLVVQTPDLSQLRTAVITADLVITLSGDGPFTVFAPLNTAFDDLAAANPDLVTALFSDPAWVLHLEDILLYHVVAGEEIEIPADGPDTEQFITTANEENIALERADNFLTVSPTIEESSQVVLTNEMATNGIVHVINGVLLPESVRFSIVDLAVSLAPEFSTLVDLVVSAGLSDILDSTFGLTVFAPTNAAFEKLPKSTVDLLTSPFGTDALVDTLLYHVIPQVIPSTLIPRGQTFLDTALEGTKVLVKAYPLTVFVNRAKIIDTDALANNGIIHAIDQVLLPPSLRQAPVPPRNIYKGKGYYYSKGYGKGYSKGYSFGKGKGGYSSKGRNYYTRGSKGGYYNGKGYSKSKSKKISKGGFFWRE